MINKLESETLPDKDSVNCINCQHCYIPQDFLLGFNPPQLFCGLSGDRPLSGDVLSEPFEYYDENTYEEQYYRWVNWAEAHKVELTNYCHKFERA